MLKWEDLRPGLVIKNKDKYFYVGNKYTENKFLFYKLFNSNVGLYFTVDFKEMDDWAKSRIIKDKKPFIKFVFEATKKQIDYLKKEI